jgi:hypothetical protein
MYAMDRHPLIIEKVARKVQDVGLTAVKLIGARAIVAGRESKIRDENECDFGFRVSALGLI